MAHGLSRRQKLKLKKNRNKALLAGKEGIMFDRRDRPADYLRGMYDDEGVFLLCGGPSMRRMDLPLLNQRGIITASVNQAATIYRPHIWFSVDPQTQFSESIWRDGAIMKFTKRKYITRFLHGWSGTSYQQIMVRPRNLSNVWGYEHTDMAKTPWNAAEFLTQSLPVWGSSTTESDPEGKQWHKSVMLIALRLLHWLGFRRVYIAGCDFLMKEKNPYGFNEAAGSGRVVSNNRLFGWLDRRFKELQPHFMEAGYTVINCTPGGNLTAFPRLDFSQAVQLEADRVPEIHTKGQYRM